MDKLKIAIIGLGRMGAEPSSRLGKLSNGWFPISHAESIKSIPNLELTAICDIDANKIKKFSTLYNVPQGFTDYKELIEKVIPDIISIATRTNLKENIINYALDHGVKGIYVEKPLSRSITTVQNCRNSVSVPATVNNFFTRRKDMKNASKNSPKAPWPKAKKSTMTKPPLSAKTFMKLFESTR